MMTADSNANAAFRVRAAPGRTLNNGPKQPQPSSRPWNHAGANVALNTASRPSAANAPSRGAVRVV